MNLKIKNSGEKQKKFGCFSGVFVPNVLTILGLILFLRIGWTVGHSGLIGALLIILLANIISFLTGLSISAVATNMYVKKGGAYYMISRSLGLEIGGAIGIPLYLSQAISVAFYVIGFSEALTLTFPSIPPREVSIALVLFFGFLSYIGAHFVIRIQFVILAILVASLFSFFSGAAEQSGVSPALFSDTKTSKGFWEVFAVFFPAVTGIMVGVSMSGDLKEPGKDIPRGTLFSIGVTALIYIGVAIWLSLNVDSQTLRAEKMVMQKVAKWPKLIILGVWASTLSSALGSMLAAPRTLQALSLDKIVPGLAGIQLGSKTEPRMAVIITTVLALVVIFLGQLNFVAKLITMFFLNTYGMINMTSGLENLIGNPSYRPRIAVHWALSLLGGIGCYATMLLIHPPGTIVAIVISYGIFFLLKRRTLRQRWGDLRAGFWIALVRIGLLRLQYHTVEPKNWRPNIVAFTGPPGTIKEREHLMQMAVWLSRGGGIVTLSHLIVGKLDELGDKDYLQTSRRLMQRYIKEKGAEAFGECTIVTEFFQGITDIAQSYGIVGTQTNTVLLGWSRKKQRHDSQLLLMQSLMRLKRSILFLKYNEKRGYGNKQRIDVWWRGRDLNAQLMLILAHIICKDKEWEGAEIRLLRFLDSEKGRDQAEKYTNEFLKKVRVDAKPVVFVKDRSQNSFTQIVLQHSADTDLILMGLSAPKKDQISDQVKRIQAFLQPMPTTLLVRCSEVEDILGAETPES
ncbi:MAG: amino acid permease [Desulfobacteraceae bacterium]|nr:amino acid permease [Desulfobacteraceae bacterium]